MTCIDGHEMTKQGRAGEALFVAATGSFFAGCVGTLVIAMQRPPLAPSPNSSRPRICSAAGVRLIAAVVIASDRPSNPWRWC